MTLDVAPAASHGPRSRRPGPTSGHDAPPDAVVPRASRILLGARVLRPVRPRRHPLDDAAPPPARSRRAGMAPRAGDGPEPRLPHHPLPIRHVPRHAVDAAARRRADGVGPRAPAEGEARPRRPRGHHAGAGVRPPGRRVGGRGSRRTRHRPRRRARLPGVRAARVLAGRRGAVRHRAAHPRDVRRPGLGLALLSFLQRPKLAFLRSADGAAFDLLELGGGDASSTVISPAIFDRFVAPFDAPLIAAAHAVAPARRLPHVRRDDADPRADRRTWAQTPWRRSRRRRWAATPGWPRPSGAWARASA